MTQRSTPVKNERAVVAVLSLAGMLISLQLTLMVPALPEIPHLLTVTANDASWLVTITLLTSTAGTPIMARMADMYGRRRILLLSLLLVASGSAIAAMTLNFPLVLLGRSLQGFGAAIIPIGISIMRDLLSPARATTGMALMSGTLGIGSAIGLPTSGVLLELGGLSSIFWVSAVAATAFLVLVHHVVPAGGDPSGGRFDLVGTLLFSLALSALLLLISKGAAWGSGSPSTLAAIAVTILGLAALIPHQLRIADPLVDIRSTLSRPVLTTNIATFFVAAGLFATHLLTIQEARAPIATGIGLGMSTLMAGLALLPYSLVQVVLAPVSARLLIRFGGRAGLVFGAGMILFAYVFRFFFHGTLTLVLIGTMLVGVGSAFGFAAMPILIMDSVPSTEAAAANGINSLIRNLAGSVTTAAYGLLFILAPWSQDATFLSRDGLRLAFAVVAVAAAAGMIIAATLPRGSARTV